MHSKKYGGGGGGGGGGGMIPTTPKGAEHYKDTINATSHLKCPICGKVPDEGGMCRKCGIMAS